MFVGDGSVHDVNVPFSSLFDVSYGVGADNGMNSLPYDLCTGMQFEFNSKGLDLPPM
ncbi:MAG: hypothetical protein IT420_04425 [Candidatus Brocadia sp.]|nr:hypothetical protein [Candidatus Brocadia sp.]